MKLSSLKICNFKNFYGINSINFNHTDGNIILIGGINGSGKTSISEAMRLCLFGKMYNKYPTQNSTYNNFILSSKNNKSKKKKNHDYFIEMEMKVDDSYPNYDITIRREWLIEGKRIMESLQLLRDGCELEIVPEEYWQEYILTLFPVNIVDYYFFDGEKVKELSIGDNAEKILEKSIKNLIGLDQIEILKNDLIRLGEKIVKRNEDKNIIFKELSELQKQNSNIDSKIHLINNKIDKNNKKIDLLNDEKQELEDQLRRKAGAYAKEEKKHSERIKDINEELIAINENIIKICSEQLPFIITKKLNQQLLKQFDNEKIIKETIISKKIFNRITKSMKSKLKGDTFSKETQIQMISLIDSMKVDYNNNPSPLIHDLTNSEMKNIENYLTSIDKDILKKLKLLLKEREEKTRMSKNINGFINNIPKDKYVNEYVEKISLSLSQIEQLKKKNEEYHQVIIELRENIDNNIEEVKKIKEKIVYTETDEMKIRISDDIIDIFEEYSEILVNLKLDDLGEKVTEMYQLLANKDDMIKQIKFERNIIKPILLDYNDEIIEKSQISEGEKEIYSLSILWGLTTISNRSFPLIIDSPLAKLDSKHVDNIMSNFFPKASKQLIILSHDREIDELGYEKVRKYISSEYTISLKDSDKIKSGYFWGVNK